MKSNRKGKCVHIGEILNQVVNSVRSESDSQLTKVWEIWSEAVGQTIAANAQPAAFKGDLLLVNVTSSPWLHQLQFLKKEIINKLNQNLGKNLINDIRFKIGPTS